VTSSLSRYVIKPGVSVGLRTQLPVVFVSGGPGGTLKYNPGETLVAALGDLSPHIQTPRNTDNAIADNSSNQSTVSLGDLRRSPLDLHHVGLLRDDRVIGIFDAIALSARGDGGPQIQAGDTITIPNKPIGVRVGGEVSRPGAAYLDADEPLSDALLQSGGLLPSASTSRIKVTADATSELLAQGDPRWTRPATAGTTIDVLIAPRVNIVGSVDKPGPVLLKTDPTLVTAIYEAGGPTKWADLRYVQVTNNGLPVKYDITRLIHGDLTQNPTLHDGDMVFVPEGHKIAFGPIFQAILSAPFIYAIH
jgi:protein involved in polysaccharide export with SLBB domain